MTVGTNGPSAEAPTVSVVIPVYNGHQYLAQAVSSVIAQTVPPAELILVDDGSTGDSGIDAVRHLPAPFPIRVVEQFNAGQSAARNHGVKVATGELLAFLDQDDRWHRDHLATLMRPFADDDVGWTYSDFEEIDEHGRTVTQSFLREHGIVHPKRTLGACLSGDLMVIPSATMVRRCAFEEIGGFDETLRGYEDDDLYLRTFRSGWRMVFRDRSLTAFRVHGSSSSANTTFAASRLRFSDKVRADVLDDRRLNRFYFRDLVAPRFFQVSLDDYVRAASDRDWGAAREACAAVEHFAGWRGLTLGLRLRLALIRDPHRFRLLLKVHELLPRRLRISSNAALRLR